MSLLITFNGQNYIIPEPSETGWGSNLDSYFVAIAAGCLQKTGGSFLLSAETDFGGSFGLKSLYYKTRASNIASTGAFRLANAETGIVWRRADNMADLALTVDASNQLNFNGHPIATSVTAKSFLYGDASGNIAATSNPTNGQLLIGSTGNIPALASLTGTVNQIIVTPGAGSITLSTPQDIALTSNPAFLSMTLNDSATPTLTVSPSGIATVTISDVKITGSDGLGLQTKHFGTGISATINGRSAGGNTQLIEDRNLFINVPSGHVVSFGVNNTEVGYFDNTGLILPSPLTVSNGGTGDASLTAYAVLCGGTTSTNPIQSIAGVGSSGQVLTSNGAGTLPTFQNVAGTGTVNSGTQYQLAYYATSTNAVSGNTTINTNANGDLLLTSVSTTALQVNTTDLIVDATNHKVGIGHSPGTDLDVQKSLSGDFVQSRVYNTSNTANSHALMFIEVAGTSGGDALIQIYRAGDAKTWYQGLDNDVSNQYTLGYSSSGLPGSTDFLTVDVSGNINIPNTRLQTGGNQVLPIVQTLQTITTSATTTTSATFVDTNCTVTITPKFNTSKILILGSGILYNDTAAAGNDAQLTVSRNNTDLSTGGGFAYTLNATNVIEYSPAGIAYYDSPATTSAITYKLRIRRPGTGGNATFPRDTGTIIVVEIAQ